MAQAKMTKQDYYETLVRNRYYLWAYTGNVCTMDNLDEAKEGRLYVPLYDEVHLEPCPRPPLKAFVLQEIRTELAIRERKRLRALQPVQTHAWAQNNGHGHDAPQMNESQPPALGSQEGFLKRRMFRMDLAPHH